MRLFIRALDQLEGTPLQGTEDAIAPFFSPDGLWIGFATEEDEKLKKVPVTGGPAITLAEDVVEQFATGSWGDDGYIVYTNSNFTLSRVPGTGGVAEEIATLDSTLNISMFWPSVLPGSKAVLFERCSNTCRVTDLVALDVASGTTKVVIPGATRGWYIATGHLVYATTNGAVYAVPFDPDRREVTGSPVPVLDQVRSGLANGARLAISPSGAIIYLTGATVQGVQVVEVDRSGRETPVLSELGLYEHPRWSPNRDRIALTVGEPTGGSLQIWIYDVASKTLTQLTREGSNYRPSWSPDGARVAYFSVGDSAVLYWMAADGSGPPERVADGEDILNGGTTFWTRDGNWLLFDGLGEAGKNDEDIFAVGTGTDRTRKPVVATAAQEETGAVSPDGRWVAHGSNEGGRWQVYVRPFMREGGRWLVSPGEGATPLWTSNNELVYLDFASASLVAARLEFTPSVRVIERIPLFRWNAYAYASQSSPAYDVSRDGQRFLVLKQPGGAVANIPPTVVLNWFEEVKARMAAQGGRQP